MTENTPTTTSRTYLIENRQGLHLRPASLLVQIFSEHIDCEVMVGAHGNRVNGKSIMGLLMLEAGPGTELTIEVEGDGAEAIFERVAEVIAMHFREE
jgi:phosphocarrier protein HPr